ncbi:hypothetical protein ACHAPJ_001922 [Fusarium lateritium]
MAETRGNPLLIEAAKPTVRRKGKYQEYGETEELDVFESLGGQPKDLMDEERWLQNPADGASTFTANNDDHSTTALEDDTSEAHADIFAERSDKRLMWKPLPMGASGTQGHLNDSNHFLDSGYRVPTEQHFVRCLIPRACKATNLDPGIWKRDDVRKLLGLSTNEPPTLDSTIEAVLVGISACDYQPVFMVKGDIKQEDGDANGSTQGQSRPRDLDGRLNADNIECVTLRTLSGTLKCGNQVIWFENTLIPGNIAYIKRALWDCLEADEKRSFLRIMKREHGLLARGVIASTVARALPSNEEENRKPGFHRPIHEDKDYDKLHYILRWPPMAVLDIPAHMIIAMQNLLKSESFDNIPLNIALAAIIIYFDLEDHGWENEGFAQDDIRPLTRCRRVSLAVFVLYFPHMLRFVEVKKLTAFIHPLRFAAENYERDCQIDPYFRIDGGGSTILSTIYMRRWYQEIRSRSLKIPSTYRFNLIPASMPGTSMVFPQRCNNAERPSTDLFALCRLNDVRTLGLPSYYDTTRHGSLDYHAGGPNWLFSEPVRQQGHKLTNIPPASYWKPELNLNLRPREMSLTGPARQVGPVFQDVESGDSYDENIKQSIERLFGQAGSYVRDVRLVDKSVQPARRDFIPKVDELNRIADFLGVPDSSRWTSRMTGCPAWEGMEAQLWDLHDKGDLKRAAAKKFPIPKAKRVARQPRLLDPGDKKKIERLIDSLAVLSEDWDPLREHLSAPYSTVEGTQDSFSAVRSFVSNLDDTFTAENATNGHGSLDKVVRMASRAAGFFDAPQATLPKDEMRWKSYHQRFSKFGQEIQDAIETIYRLRGTVNEFKLALHHIKILKGSRMIRDQVEVYKMIDAILRKHSPIP